MRAIPMPAATAETCCRAFIEGWVSDFGLCEDVITDNGNTFIASLWTKMQEALGIDVSYTPLYHAASLGHLERQHRDLKASLRSALLEMGDSFGSSWTSVLPWTMLGKRTAFQPDLGASPAELVYGQTLVVPGDLAGAELKPQSTLPNLLEQLRRNAAKPPVQTAHHDQPQVHLPKDMETATHVLVKKEKTTPLGGKYDGPFEILQRRGQSCLLLRVGSKANGEPRTELVHWSNCKVHYFLDEPYTVDRPALGRKSGT